MNLMADVDGRVLASLRISVQDATSKVNLFFGEP